MCFACPNCECEDLSISISEFLFWVSGREVAKKLFFCNRCGSTFLEPEEEKTEGKEYGK